MKTIKRLATVAIIAMFLTAPVMAQDEIYSTLADRKNADGGWAVGYALGYPTPGKAQHKAMAECAKQGIGQCIPLFTFPGPVCVAIAEGDDGAAGWGGGDVTRADARADALRKCGEFGDNCRITASDCTGDGPVAKSDLIESDDPLLGQWKLEETTQYANGTAHFSVNLDINEKLDNGSYSGIEIINLKQIIDGVSASCSTRYRVSFSLSSIDSGDMSEHKLSGNCGYYSENNLPFLLQGNELVTKYPSGEDFFRYTKVN